MRMYEIAWQYRDIVVAMHDGDGIDEDGVVLTVEELRAKLDAVDDARDEKVLAVAGLIQDMRRDEYELKAERDRLDERRSSLEARRRNLQQTLVGFMEATGGAKTVGLRYTVWLQRTGQRVVINEDEFEYRARRGEIDEEFLLPPKPREPAKKAILAAIGDGRHAEVSDWASVEDGEPTLRIK